MSLSSKMCSQTLSQSIMKLLILLSSSTINQATSSFPSVLMLSTPILFPIISLQSLITLSLWVAYSICFAIMSLRQPSLGVWLTIILNRKRMRFVKQTLHSSTNTTNYKKRWWSSTMQIVSKKNTGL